MQSAFQHRGCQSVGVKLLVGSQMDVSVFSGIRKCIFSSRASPPVCGEQAVALVIAWGQLCTALASLPLLVLEARDVNRDHGWQARKEHSRESQQQLKAGYHLDPGWQSSHSPQPAPLLSRLISFAFLHRP